MHLISFAPYKVLVPIGQDVFRSGQYFIFYPLIRDWLDEEEVIFGHDWTANASDNDDSKVVFYFTDRILAIKFSLRWL